ncbi:hypothetical protein ANCCEY_14825 [Ancylostoma ceylanicum]|uniref:Phlebovirus glycoprotein G2 fusion domain-containing protein n=1 Tax=Ancylostoma ceylanicum TaxID=53326 RepID=A0A0D6L4V6_9BILA|nr:hypothetical protein ANCCEY_14825 [Ancylostoma ceylanicum]
MALISPTVANQQPSITCYDGKVKIAPPAGSFQVCFDENCKTFDGVMQTLNFSLPISPHNSQTNVALILSSNKERLDYKCDPPKYCDHQYFLSKSLLGNPHCWPMGAIGSAVILVHVALLIIAALICTIRKLTTSKTRNLVEEIPMIEPMIERQSNGATGLQAFVPAPLPCTKLLAICILLSSAAFSVDACQHGYTRHSVNLVCDESNVCFYHHNEEILFNKLTSEVCIEATYSNKTLGFIKITKKPMKLLCSKILESFTRDTTVRVHHVERCAQAGSCVGNKCHTMPSTETVHELRRYKKYPGYSGCIPICGGIPCGCFLPLPACQFYRIVNRPISRVVYEVVRCSEWIPTIELEMEVTWAGEKTVRTMITKPYMTETVEGYNITVISVQKPMIAAMNQRFAISNDEAFALPERFVVPVECADETQAQFNFSTCNNRIRCHCENSVHRCQCPDESIHLLRNSPSALPINSSLVNLGQIDNNVVATTDEGEFVVVVESKKAAETQEIAEVVTNENCDIQTQVIGCYSCAHGAMLTTSCRSKMTTEITIACENHEFTIKCGPTNATTTTLLAFNHAIVEERCKTDCSGTSEYVVLHGTLHYHVEIPNMTIFEAADHHVPIKRQWLSDFSMPDINPLIKAVTKHWKLTMVAIASAFSITVLLYLLGPIVLVYVVKFLFRIILLTISLVARVVRAAASSCSPTRNQLRSTRSIELKRRLETSKSRRQNFGIEGEDQHAEITRRGEREQSKSTAYPTSSFESSDAPAGHLESPASGLPAEAVENTNAVRAAVRAVQGVQTWMNKPSKEGSMYKFALPYITRFHPAPLSLINSVQCT